jgi:hypothetical protein
MTFEHLHEDGDFIANWERRGRIPFGEFSVESIVIDLYSNEDESSHFVGFRSNWISLAGLSIHIV